MGLCSLTNNRFTCLRCLLTISIKVRKRVRCPFLASLCYNRGVFSFMIAINITSGLASSRLGRMWDDRAVPIGASFGWINGRFKSLWFITIDWRMDTCISGAKVFVRGGIENFCRSISIDTMCDNSLHSWDCLRIITFGRACSRIVRTW